MSGVQTSTPLPRSGTDRVAGADPSPSTTASTALPKTSRQASPDMPEGRGPAASQATSMPTRKRSAASALQVALLGREFDWSDKVRMRSGAAVDALQSGLARQGQRTTDALEDMVAPAVDYIAQAGEAQQLAAGAAAVTATSGTVAWVASGNLVTTALAQQWMDGARALAPVVLPAVALAVGASAVEYAAPSGPLRELERIGDGPHARPLAELVERLLDGHTDELRETLRPILLEALPALDRIRQGPYAAATMNIVEHLLPIERAVDGTPLPSRPFVLAALPALERMARGPHASQALPLALELLGQGVDGSGRERRRPELLAAFEALASPHAAEVCGLVRSLCPPSVQGSRSVDAAALTGLATIAAGPKAPEVFGFVRSQLDACREGPERAAVTARLVAVMPALGGLAHGAGCADVIGAYHRVLRDHAGANSDGVLRLALLERLPAFGQLFAQPADDVRSVSKFLIAREGVPFRGEHGRERQAVATAVSHLTATRPANPLNRLLGLTTAPDAIAFWLMKAGDPNGRR